MTIRKSIKHLLYGRFPGFSGSFPYFQTKVYFPANSHLFAEVCSQGVFESNIVDIIRSLIVPDTYYLDVGGNIGLMAVPFLRNNPTCKVVTFEPSPNSLPFLNKTLAVSDFTERWKIVPKALSSKVGTSEFAVSTSSMSPYDGFKDTKRSGLTSMVTVDVTTLDTEWDILGQPRVSVIKCDVEGAEIDVLEGARKLVAACRPAIVIEWNSINLAAYGCGHGALLEFSASVNYRVYSLPLIVPILDLNQLNLNMSLGKENFLLIPESASF